MVEPGRKPALQATEESSIKDMKHRMSFIAALMALVVGISSGCGSTEYAKLAPRVIPGQSILGQNTPFLGKPVEILKDGTNLVVNFIHADEREFSGGIAVDISSLSVVSDEDGRVQRVLPSEGRIRYQLTSLDSVATSTSLPTDLFTRVRPGKSTLAEVSAIVGNPCRIGLTHSPKLRVAEWFFARVLGTTGRYDCRYLTALVDESDRIHSMEIREGRLNFNGDHRWLVPPRPSEGILVDSLTGNR